MFQRFFPVFQDTRTRLRRQTRRWRQGLGTHGKREPNPPRLDNVPANPERCGEWLDCHTQEEIADAVGVTHQTISNWLANFGQTSEFCKSPASLHHFDVWDFVKPDDSAGGKIFGRMPGGRGIKPERRKAEKGANILAKYFAHTVCVNEFNLQFFSIFPAGS
jgi:hypothetical protein